MKTTVGGRCPAISIDEDDFYYSNFWICKLDHSIRSSHRWHDDVIMQSHYNLISHINSNHENKRNHELIEKEYEIIFTTCNSGIQNCH